MSDLVRVNVGVDYIAWKTPDSARLVVAAMPHVVGGVTEVETPLTEVPPGVVDALARQWLDHLYAGLNRESPFKLIGGDA